MTKVIAIVGPTAVGKTALSVELAKQLKGEVISGDSMQVYRRLDVGTAKVTPEEQQGIPHHLIDICDVDEQYSVARFKQEANSAIKDIAKRGHLPIIAGGTGFYLQALTDNLSLGGKQDKDSEAIRQRWQELIDENGPEWGWQQLNAKDPQAAANIPVQNIRRVIRALEVIEISKKPFSEQEQRTSLDEYLLIGLTTDRQVLYQRINQRVDIMIQNGLLGEARALYEQGGKNLPAGKGIGYHELFPYFAGEVDLDYAVDKIKLDSRHYAKRQLTWFRNKMTVNWFDLVSGQNSINEIKSFIEDWLRN